MSVKPRRALKRDSLSFKEGPASVLTAVAFLRARVLWAPVPDGHFSTGF